MTVPTPWDLGSGPERAGASQPVGGQPLTAGSPRCPGTTCSRTVSGPSVRATHFTKRGQCPCKCRLLPAARRSEDGKECLPDALAIYDQESPSARVLTVSELLRPCPWAASLLSSLLSPPLKSPGLGGCTVSVLHVPPPSHEAASLSLEKPPWGGWGDRRLPRFMNSPSRRLTRIRVLRWTLLM